MSETKVIDGDLHVNGALHAGNFMFGSVRISSEEETPSSEQVTGINLRGTGDMSIFVTAYSRTAGDKMKQVTVEPETPNEFSIFIFRTNAINSTVYWFVWR